jgi:hypothetical protein
MAKQGSWGTVESRALRARLAKEDPVLGQVKTARLHVECALDTLEEQSAEDFRLHKIYEQLQSAWNSLRIFEGEKP